MKGGAKEDAFITLTQQHIEWGKAESVSTKILNQLGMLTLNSSI